MSRTRIFWFTSLAMVAFAGNSLLCRQALKHTSIDPASFTCLRILSGALALRLITRLRGGTRAASGSWRSALALFAYAAGFSYAYLSLTAATGALLLFGAVQVSMVGYGLWSGERLSARQTAGLGLALAGLVLLLLPGITAPPLRASTLMLGAGVAWGIYSLRGRGAVDPTSVTAGNFLRAAPMASALLLICLPWMRLPPSGIYYAICSGALASGAGYALWYGALPGLQATSAATVQLMVPVLTAFGGVIFLGEAITARLSVASATILGGIALVVIRRQTTGCRNPGDKERG